MSKLIKAHCLKCGTRIKQYEVDFCKSLCVSCDEIRIQKEWKEIQIGLRLAREIRKNRSD